MPLFTTWYALIPGIILCLTGGIRPYAPRQFVINPAAFCDRSDSDSERKSTNLELGLAKKFRK
jgi:hypothetical protein